MKWEQVTKCVLCGGTKFELYQKSGVNVRLPEFPNTVLYYVRCKCGLIFQNPHLNAASIEEYYASGHYRRSVLGSRTGHDESELRRQQSLITLVEGKTLLDVGCSRGFLVRLAWAKNIVALGVEPYADYVMPEVPCVRTIDEVTEKYDTVTCIKVLEHISNPVEFAEKLIDRTGKRLIVEVPSKKSQGGPWRLPHLYYFTDAIMERIFDRLKLIATLKTPSSLYVFETE